MKALIVTRLSLKVRNIKNMIIKDKLNFKIKKNFEIKRIKIKDISIEYIKSLNVAAYLKFKKKHTLNSQSNYLKKINNSRNNFIVGIFHKKNLLEQ